MAFCWSGASWESAVRTAPAFSRIQSEAAESVSPARGAGCNSLADSASSSARRLRMRTRSMARLRVSVAAQLKTEPRLDS